jgi:lysophospholipase L1-like esterase
MRSCSSCPKIDDDCYDWYLRHENKCLEISSVNPDLIFIGDSITHFWAPEDACCYGEKVWQKYYSKRKVVNLGFGFDRTQNMLWRLENGEGNCLPPRAVVVNAGTNQFSITENYSGDTPYEAFCGVRMLLNKIRSLWPQSEIIVMGVFPRLPEEPTQKYIDELNRLLKYYICTSSDSRMKFFDIGSQLRNPDGSFNRDLYADQGCHPNEAGYLIWARAIEPEISRILGDSVQ